MKPADEVLREVLAERADGITPDGDVYGAVLARRRRGRRRAVIGAGVAANRIEAVGSAGKGKSGQVEIRLEGAD